MQTGLPQAIEMNNFCHDLDDQELINKAEDQNDSHVGRQASDDEQNRNLGMSTSVQAGYVESEGQPLAAFTDDKMVERKIKEATIPLGWRKGHHHSMVDRTSRLLESTTLSKNRRAVPPVDSICTPMTMT